MATVYPTAAGAWSTRTWNDDATGAAYGMEPQTGDIVKANGLAITIDVDITVAELQTIAGTTAAAGGSFTTSGTRVVNAISRAGTTTCLVLAADGTQNGNSYGSETTNNSYGTSVALGGTQNGNAYGANGTLRSGSDVLGTLNGDTFGGTAGFSYGARVRNFGVQNGNSYGGTNSSAFGTALTFGAKQFGNSFGNDTVACAGTEAQNGGNQIGDSYGGAFTNSVGTQLGSGTFQSGNAYGGSASGSTGTTVTNGGIFYGNASGGTGANAFGVDINNGAIAVLSVTTSSTAKAARLANFGHVILRGDALESELLISASGGLREVSIDSSANFPFLIAPSTGGIPIGRIISGGV